MISLSTFVELQQRGSVCQVLNYTATIPCSRLAVDQHSVLQ